MIIAVRCLKQANDNRSKPVFDLAYEEAEREIAISDHAGDRTRAADVRAAQDLRSCAVMVYNAHLGLGHPEYPETADTALAADSCVMELSKLVK